MASIDESATLLDMFYHWERQKPDATYLMQPRQQVWSEYSWRQVGEQARRMAAALRAMGLKPTDRVSILSRNCAEWLIADLAIMMGGYSSAPVFTTMSAADVHYCLSHSGSKALFVGQAENWGPVSEALPEGMRIIAMPYAEVREAQHQWQDLLEQHAPLAGNPERALDDEVTTIFTSGSTGQPKGVVYSFAGAGHIVRNIAQTYRLEESDCFISYLPLAHGFERGVVAFTSLYTGSTIGFNEEQATFADDMRTVRPTFFQCVPRLWSKFQQSLLEGFGGQRTLDAMLADPATADATQKRIREALGLDRARVLTTGSAPTAPALHAWYEALDMPLCEIYGQTEVLSGTCNLPWARKPGTLGRPMANTEVRITAEGEVLIRALARMQSYLHEPQKTADTLIDGWIHTGDRGELDDEGFLRLTGRIKEQFKTAKGKYVAPLPIESRFSTNLNLEQLCLIGAGLAQTVLLAQLSEQGRTADPAILELDLSRFIAEVNQGLDKHARIAALLLTECDWSPANGLATHTLKIKRSALEARYRHLAEAALSGAVSTAEPRVIWV